MVDNSIIKNEFLLHLKCKNIEKADELFLTLINRDGLDVVLVSKKIFKAEDKVAYRLKITPSSLILLKKLIDETINYEWLQLFEFKEW